MRFLSFVHRFIADFAFLAVAYFSLNFMEQYRNRAILAILVLIYSAMRAVSTLRLFYFYQCIEKLEVEGRRLVAAIVDAGVISPLRKQTINDVSGIRHDNELKAYMDLFFLALVVLLCVVKIVTD